LVFRVAFGQFLNTCVSMMFTYLDYDLWSSRGNLLDTSILFMLSNTLAPFGQILGASFQEKFVKRRQKQKAITTDDLDRACLPVGWQIERR